MTNMTALANPYRMEWEWYHREIRGSNSLTSKRYCTGTSKTNETKTALVWSKMSVCRLQVMCMSKDSSTRTRNNVRSIECEQTRSS